MRILARSPVPRMAFGLVLVLALGACDLGTGRAPAAGPTAVPIIPRATRTPGPQDVAMAAFVELVTADDFSYRMSYEGGVGLSTAQLPLEGRTDVAGANFQSTFTLDFSKDYPHLPDPIKVTVRGVDGKGYLRRDSGRWMDIKVGTAGQTTTAFWAIETVRDVKFLATEERDSGTFYRIQVPKAVLIHPIVIPFKIRAEKVRKTSLEILIDAEGRPVIGTWEGENQARIGDSGQLQGVDFELRLTFSKLGDPFEIEAP